MCAGGRLQIRGGLGHSRSVRTSRSPVGWPSVGQKEVAASGQNPMIADTGRSPIVTISPMMREFDCDLRDRSGRRLRWRRSLRKKGEACGGGCLNDSEVAAVQCEDRAVAESFGKCDDGSVCAAEA